MKKKVRQNAIPKYYRWCL